MRVRFYGTRGSLPTPGPATLRYGGNTSCVSVRSDAGTHIILDIGTGGAVLGRELMAQGGPLRGHILIGHTHWDHIQGLPFFAPLFVPGNEWDIYAPRGLQETVRETLAGQMQHTYFPVDLDQLGATVRYHDLNEGVLQIGDIRVTAQYLNHPALTLGYRLEADGDAVVYACDHEPHSHALAEPKGGLFQGQDLQHVEFLADAGLVIHDAQYLASEYSSKVGWGHSTVEYAIAAAQKAGARRLALTHHDPVRTDAALDEIVQQITARGGLGRLEVFAAAEGQEIELRGSTLLRKLKANPAEAPIGQALIGVKILVAVSTPALVETLAEALDKEGIRWLVVDPSEAEATAARERPSLLVLEDLGVPRAATIARGVHDAGIDLPIVLVGDSHSPPDTEDLFVERLIKPFSPSYARARLRAALLRRACRWQRAATPSDEVRRIASLRALKVLDTPREERFDRITRLAAALFDVPVALISLIDEDRQWFKSTCGIDAKDTPRDESFCAHAVVSRAPLVIPDALLDERFAENPVVVGLPRVRFYAGYPLFLADGSCIGTLCVLDTRPRDLDAADLARLADLAALATREFEDTEAVEAAITVPAQ